MDPWSSVGLLWDQAVDGDPGSAAATAAALETTAGNDATRAILMGSRVLCEILLCRYEDATRTAMEAVRVANSATGPLAGDARFYAASIRLVALGMFDPDIAGVRDTFGPEPEIPALATLLAHAAGIPIDHPARLLLLYPTLEACMSSGGFGAVTNLGDGLRPFVAADARFSERIRPLVMTQLARSAAFSGDLDGLTAVAAEILALPGIQRATNLVMLTRALQCYAAGQRSQRKEVEALARQVLAVAHGRVDYIAVGSCLLVTWALSAIGQVQRAAALLVAASGGPQLPRIKIWDQSFGYELLVTAAVRRNDLAGATAWAVRAEQLAGVPVAAAAVERTLSRLAVAMGEHEDAARRAHASAALDEKSGARLDGLRARVLYASALASSGQRELAITTLAEIAEKADQLGASSVRKLAASQWRALSREARTVDGGFASLSDREREIAVLVAEGHTNRSIGSTLFLSERTVQTHLSRILGVLGLPSRTAIPAALGVGASDVDSPALTERQEQIAELVAKGHSNSQIGAELEISVKTVENHLAGIFARWQVSSRTAVANLYVARNRRSA